jgi:spore maturation protein SpmA
MDIFPRQIALEADRQMLLQLASDQLQLSRKSRPALSIQQIVALDIGLLRTGDKIGPMDQVGRIDRPVAKAQMRNGNAAGFFES